MTAPKVGRPPITTRYPLDPLYKAMGLSPHQAGIALGLSGSTQQDYRRRGVTERVADRLAIRAGLSPYEIWPEMVDDQIASLHVPCARHDCDGTFIPVQATQKTCSPRCSTLVRQRRRRATPTGAAAARESAARYYRENRTYVRDQQRRRRAEASGR